MQEGPSHHPHHHHQLLIHQQQQQQQQQPPPPPQQRSQRYGGGSLRTTAGEIVEVQGGHIVRSTGRKDRHSKVCTAKGPRDRRVRLSAHTAIQFYDVQDRLGYDRPSKAVNWLIQNAKDAIDELAELPAWHPTATTKAVAAATANQEAAAAHGESNNKQTHVAEQGSSSHYEFNSGSGGGCASFLLPSLGSDAIADTIKSFFPVAAAAASSSAPSSSLPIGFQSYPPPDLLSRTSSQNQDLRLSLQSFQDPIFHHHNVAQHHQDNHPNPDAASSHHAALFSAFDPAAIIPWNMAESSSGGGGGNAGGGGGGGYVFNVPLQQQPATIAMHPALWQSQFFTQRGPLQSSNLPFVHAWADPMAAAADHHPMQQHSVIHPSIGFASGGGSGGFSGFRIPARIQGEEEHDGFSDKPSSASSGSHH